MRIRNRRLRRLYGSGQSRGLPAEHLPRIRKILDDLALAEKPSDMNNPGLRLHRLSGNMRDYWSVRVSGNWRIIFRFENGEAVDIDYVDYH